MAYPKKVTTEVTMEVTAEVTAEVSWEPIEVLYHLDFPRIFTCLVAGDLHLACWHDESDTESHWLLVPTTPDSLEALKAGRLSLREAMTQPRILVARLNHQGACLGARWVAPEQLPTDALPRVGAKLSPSSQVDPFGRSLTAPRNDSGEVGAL